MDAFRLVSWNLAMLERSAQAPPGWGVEQTEAVVVERLLHADPDLVHFQELPGLVPYLPTHGMVTSNPESHQGHLATLVRRGIATDAVAASPFVVLVTIGDLTVANVHLAPGPGRPAAQLRHGQLAAVVAASPTEALLVLGDTNTRTDELDAIDELGLRSAPLPSPSWHGTRNRFRADGPRFTASFSRWFATDAVVVDEVAVWDTPIEVDGHRFHPSDHFAVAVTARVQH